MLDILEVVICLLSRGGMAAENPTSSAPKTVKHAPPGSTEWIPK